jgi:hypothetical protein
MSTRNANDVLTATTRINHTRERNLVAAVATTDTNTDTEIIEINEADDQSNGNSDTDSPDIGTDDYDFKQNKITRFNSITSDSNKDDEKAGKPDEGEGEVSRSNPIDQLTLIQQIKVICFKFCPICFEPWTNSGNHRLVCLKCGHLFGERYVLSFISQIISIENKIIYF